MPQHTELAAATLVLINQAKVPASDNDLMLALTLRGWLKDIAAGKLEVVEIPDGSAAPIEDKNELSAIKDSVRRSNGSNKLPVPC